MNKFLYQLNGYEAKRKRLLKKAPAGIVKDYLSVPFPSPDELINNCKIIALDFETTGLDPNKDKLLSVGFVEMQGNEILISTAYHQIIRTNEALKAENVIIHRITDDAKDAGMALKEVVDHLLEALAGKVMLVHFHNIEKQFLNKACQLLYGMPIIFPIIDTLFVEKRKLDKKDIGYDPSELRLSSLRDRHELPEHRAHNALTDAIATAELFLAQTSNSGETKLEQVLL